MTYAATARRYEIARQSTRAGAAPSPEALAADKLPMSAGCELIRDQLSPATIARYHAGHVSKLATDLRKAVSKDARKQKAALTYVQDVENAARALLAAIGEGE